MISGEKKALVLAHPFLVKASKYPNEAPQRPETCIEQLYKPTRMKKGTKIDTANLVIILDMKPLWSHSLSYKDAMTRLKVTFSTTRSTSSFR